MLVDQMYVYDGPTKDRDLFGLLLSDMTSISFKDMEV